jgi:hypothetical protein
LGWVGARRGRRGRWSKKPKAQARARFGAEVREPRTGGSGCGGGAEMPNPRDADGVGGAAWRGTAGEVVDWTTGVLYWTRPRLGRRRHLCVR